jgi:hypothetical protein
MTASSPIWTCVYLLSDGYRALAISRNDLSRGGRAFCNQQELLFLIFQLVPRVHYIVSYYAAWSGDVG